MSVGRLDFAAAEFPALMDVMKCSVPGGAEHARGAEIAPGVQFRG